MTRQDIAGCALLLFLLGFQSCLPFRKSSRKSKVPPVIVAVDSFKTDSTKITGESVDLKDSILQSFIPLFNNQLAFSTFSGKAKMHYEGKEQKHEFTSHFRIKRDSAIWVSVTALGGIVQVARLLVTPDSFKMINYLEKEVTIMSLAEAQNVLPAPADYSILQNLVIGNVLKAEGKPTDATDAGQLILLQVETPDLIQRITYNKEDSSIKTIQMRSPALNGPDGVIQLDDYANVDGRKFSMNRAVNVINSGDHYYLDMNFANVSFDAPVELPFSIPKNFKKK
jgi:hypothetical protein